MIKSVAIALMVFACAGAALKPAAKAQPQATTKLSTTQPSTKPSTSKPASRKQEADSTKSAVRNAVTALAKEYEKYLQHSASDIRAECTYFKDHPDPSPSAESIVAALLTPGGDARVSAYVKWQLLSGLPSEMDEATAKGLLAAYRSAPALIARPGMSAADQQRLDQAVQGVPQSEEPALKEKIESAISANRRDNTPILAYRDELYHRLPKNAETFAAALDDMLQRTSAAAEGKDLIKAYNTDVRTWIAGSEAPLPKVLLALGKATRRLADTKSPSYYDAPYWRERGGVFAWRKTRSGIDTGHALKDLAVLLEEQAAQPPIDLTIKEKK